MNNSPFLASETFWVGFGSVATSFTLIFTILKSKLEHNDKIKNIKASLISEIITNINLLFSGRVERPSLFNVINKIRTYFIQDIKDTDSFIKIQKLYSNLEYYQRVCS